MNKEEKKKLTPNLIDYSVVRDTFRSEYGTKYQNGLRYPDFYNVEGPYKYDLSIFDLFVQFMYDEKLSKDSKIKWPYETEKENMSFVRELIIEQVGRRHYQVLNNPFYYSTMANFNYNHLMLCCNELDLNLTLSFDDYIKEFRTYQRPHNLSIGHTQSNVHFKSSNKEKPQSKKIKPLIMALYMAGSLAMSLAIYKCVDISNTSFEEYSEMLDREGLDEDEKFKRIISLLPDQDDKLEYMNLNHFPSSDKTIDEKDKELRKLLEEEGTQGLLMHYLSLVNELDDTNVTQEQLADYYVSSYFITQLIPEVQLCQAIEDYNQANPKDCIPINHIKSINQESRELKSDPHGVYTIVYEDDSQKLLYPETKDSITIMDYTDSSLNVDTYYSPRFEESYNKAKNSLINGDYKQTISELDKTRQLTQIALNMLTSKPEIKNKFPFLAKEDYSFNKSGISEKEMKQRIEELGQK